MVETPDNVSEGVLNVGLGDPWSLQRGLQDQNAIDISHITSLLDKASCDTLVIACRGCGRQIHLGEVRLTCRVDANPQVAVGQGEKLDDARGEEAISPRAGPG